MGEVIVQYEQLKKICTEKLIKTGIPRKHAVIVADILVHADLRGVHSHGVLRVSHYIQRIRSGGINLHPNFRITEKGSSLLQFDGDDGLGHVIAKKAMDEAIKRASETGICFVGITNSSHCGALSYYVQMAAQNQMIGLALTHTDKAVVPFGGSKPFFGTNPIAFGVPSKKYDPIILDMATSEVALGKIFHARNQNVTIPDTWGVDHEGKPTSDPHQVEAVLPFGGAKGYGLAMMVDVLSGVLTGSNYGPHIMKMYEDYDKKRKLGHIVVTIDISIFTSATHFLTKIDQMIEEIHQMSPAPGIERVLIPGEPEQIKMRKHLKEGIPITQSVYNELIS